MRSPLSQIPRLARRRPRPPHERLLLGIPRISPVRELAAIAALIKPQAGRKLSQQIDTGEQRWPADASWRIDVLAGLAKEHLGFDENFHEPPAGEYLAIASYDPARQAAALATVLLFSHGFPGVWIVVDRLFVLDGEIHRRPRGVELELKPATNVHLTRPMRASLRQAVRSAEKAVSLLN